MASIAVVPVERRMQIVGLYRLILGVNAIATRRKQSCQQIMRP